MISSEFCPNTYLNGLEWLIYYFDACKNHKVKNKTFVWYKKTNFDYEVSFKFTVFNNKQCFFNVSSSV